LVTQAHRVVVAIGIAEAQKESSRGVHPEAARQLLAKQAHRGRAQDDHPLLLKADEPLFGPEIQQLLQVHTFRVHLSSTVPQSGADAHGTASAAPTISI
jgi:hypothetical protein